MMTVFFMHGLSACVLNWSKRLLEWM